jgi:type VI secretion system secreted protein VgrG
MRKLFDTRDGEDAAHTEASIPVRSLSFHGGPGSDHTVGAAFPFRDGVEVLWASVDGDPSRPIILGTLPDPSTQSPVTSRNFGDNIIRTGGKNELLMHDIKGEEHIELKQGDYDRPFNLMRLDANSAGHSIRFACTLGAMQVYAKQTMKVEAGDSITQTHGNDRTETVENSHSLTTKNKDIHYQAATDQTHDAKDNITHKADKNIEHKSGAATQWSVSRNAVITVKQGNQIIKIDNGSLHIQAAKGISIKGTGSGSIKIGQSGAGIEIDAGGNVKLYGKAVTIGGSSGVNGMRWNKAAL